jgi:type IV secretory pathway VirJ component
MASPFRAATAASRMRLTVSTMMTERNNENAMTVLPTMNAILAADVPLLQWSSGKTQVKLPGKSHFAGTVGFHSEAGRYDDFDEACAAASVPRVDIRHQSGEVKSHFFFSETLTVLPLTAGPTITSMFALKARDNAQRMAAAGIGARWTTDQQDRPRSQVAVRCFLPVLVANGSWHMVQIVGSSTMSDYLLKALADHTRACHAASKELGQPVFAAELELPLGAGAEVTVGKTQQMTLVPFTSMHPKTVTRQYVDEAYHADAAPVVADVWESVLSWASEYTAPAEQVEQPRTAPPPIDDIYLPATVDELETCIRQARKVELLAAYGQHLLDLRNRREIDAAEQQRLSALIDEQHEELIAFS